MSDPLENRLAESLRRSARAVNVENELAARAVRRAKLIRRRRYQASALAAVVALVVAAVPLGMNTLGGTDGTTRYDTATPDSAEPEPSTPEPTAEPEPLGDPAHTQVELSNLPEGEPPAVPYLAGDVLVDGDRELEVPDGTQEVRPVAGGYLLTTFGADAGTVVTLMRPDGSTRELVSGSSVTTAVSADGRLVAWADQSGEAEPATGLTLFDSVTEQVRASEQLSGAFGVGGFFRGTVAVNELPTPGEGDFGAAFSWNPDTDGIEPLDGLEQVHLTAAGSGVAAGFAGEQDGFTPCVAVIDVAAEDGALWDSCDLRVEGFAPGGELASAVDIMSDGLGPSGFTVVRATNGDPVLTLDTGLSQRLVFEPGAARRSVLVDVTQDNQSAIVRCDLDGECERATPIDGPYEPPEDSAPYVLPEQ